VTNLDLIYVWRVDLRKALQFLDMSNTPITDSDTSGFSILKQLLQCLVNLFPTLGAHASSVDQEEVDISVLAIDFLDTV